MHSTGLSVLALVLAATGVNAFLDTSPFFLFSTSAEFTSTLSPSLIQSSESITRDVHQTLSSCPTEKYILISQEGVTTSDYKSSRSTPHLAKSLSARSNQHQSQLSLPEVSDEVDWQSFERVLVDRCGVEPLTLDARSNTIPTNVDINDLLRITFPAPTHDSERSAVMSKHDAYLATVIEMLSSSDYTVIYTTTPRIPTDSARTGPATNFSVIQDVETSDYEMDSQIVEVMYTELKRDLSVHEKRASNETLVEGPLFHRYQFFSPAIFMGLTVAILLLSILYVGVSALASLQVTYGAFDKDNGPLASKKQ